MTVKQLLGILMILVGVLSLIPTFAPFLPESVQDAGWVAVVFVLTYLCPVISFIASISTIYFGVLAIRKK